MALIARWEPSRLSESEYLEIWEDKPHGKLVRIRFSDHNASDNYRCDCGECESHQFEVAYQYGHDEVMGSCYDAIAWVARMFNRSLLLPDWVLPKIYEVPIAA
ncbi:hypothetical protein HY091_01590 [Candidatus Kaiserbacteria bacterium]|nr:hypothetical protein [Candidatus Kaiserbacteria bacterium]